MVFVSPLPYAMSGRMEKHYPPFQPGVVKTNQPVHILVLGGGYTNDPSLPATSQLGSTVALRMMEGLRVYRTLPGSKVVTSGAALDKSRSQAEAVADAAVTLGVAPADTFHLPNTLTTEHEAAMYVKRFGTETPVIIATSALHIPRAMFWFQHFGVTTIIPAPCDHLVKNDPETTSFRWWPGLKKGMVLNKVIHETVGLWWGKLKTKTDK